MNIYSIRNKGVAGNIWKFAILYITNKRPYMTFLSIFLLTMPNTTAQTIGFLTLVGQIAGILFEVPSGYISDKLGHKNALIIAKLAYFISTLCYIFANSKLYFYLGSIFFAIGIAMLSGTTSTFLKESLDYLGYGKQYSSISGKLRSFGFAVPIILILLVSFVAEKDYRLAFLIVAFIDIIGLIITLFLQSVPKEEKIEEFNISKRKNIFKQYWSLPWVPYVFAIEIIMGIIFGSTIGFKNPYQESLGISIAVIGILWALSRLGISALLLLNGKIKKHLNFNEFIFLQGTLFSLALLLAGFSRNKWLVAFGFILGTISMWGLSSAKSHYYLDFLKDQENKVSMLSINAFLQKIIIGISGLSMGYLVYHFGYKKSFIFYGSIIFILNILFFFLLKRKIKNT